MNKKPILLVVTCLLSVVPAFGQRASEEKKLITIGDFGRSMAIGLSVTSTNRVFVAFPNYNGNGNLAVAELKDRKLIPYPDTKWNKKADQGSAFLRVQDLFVDARDNLWVLDSRPGAAGNIFGKGQGTPAGQFKLIKINTRTNKVEDIYTFDDLDKSRSALNDVRVDLSRNLAYLSDPGLAAIVVLDLKTGKSRTVLRDSKFTKADNIVLKYDNGEMKDRNGNPFSSNVNGIALTHDFKYFYFKPINKESLFRIETRFLADSSLSDAELENKVVNAGNVGITHGLLADKHGNIYLTNSESYAISYLTPGGNLRTLVKDSNILWPDSMGIGDDGYLYFTCAQLQLLAQWNDGKDLTRYPYRAYKVRLPTE